MLAGVGGAAIGLKLLTGELRGVGVEVLEGDDTTQGSGGEVAANLLLGDEEEIYGYGPVMGVPVCLARASSRRQRAESDSASQGGGSVGAGGRTGAWRL